MAPPLVEFGGVRCLHREFSWREQEDGTFALYYRVPRHMIKRSRRTEGMWLPVVGEYPEGIAQPGDPRVETIRRA